MVLCVVRWSATLVHDSNHVASNHRPKISAVICIRKFCLQFVVV